MGVNSGSTLATIWDNKHAGKEMSRHLGKRQRDMIRLIIYLEYVVLLNSTVDVVGCCTAWIELDGLTYSIDVRAVAN